MLTPFAFGDSLAPSIEVSKEVTLFIDADSNGVTSPGDRLLYTITITNSGNMDVIDNVGINSLKTTSRQIPAMRRVL